MDYNYNNSCNYLAALVFVNASGHVIKVVGNGSNNHPLDSDNRSGGNDPDRIVRIAEKKNETNYTV